MRRPRVIIVDDEKASRAVVQSALAGLDIDLVECASADEALAAVADPPDVMVVDLMMPGMDGLELTERLRLAGATRDVPVLMLTAHTGRQEKLRALEAGVDDFLSKPVDRLELRTRVSAICRFNRVRRVLEERQRLDSLVSLSPNGVLVVDGASGQIRFANARAEELLGAPLVDRTLPDVLGDGPARDAAGVLLAQIRDGVPMVTDAASWALASGARVCDVVAGRVEWIGEPALQLVLTDVTALRKFAREVHNHERLETTARMAASVAHDFATVLQVCIVHLRTLSGPAPMDVAQLAIVEMRNAIRRGSQLTRDLLGFTRRGTELPGGNCDATVVATDTARLLPSLVPLTITVELSVPSVPCLVGIADYQLEQALVNLATNARDAMPAGGVLAISVAPRASGDGWVEITVRDSGTGMDPRVRDRLGEPFVSTKAEGQGTGLGLWSVRRMLDGAHGSWDIDTEPGRGTTVRLLLPPAAEGYLRQIK